MAIYKIVFTDVGLAKLSNAQVTQEKLNITHMAIGDANGTPYTPTGQETALKNEVYRTTAIVKTSDDDANWIEVEGVIPADVGNFTIEEFGLYDADGDLVAISNYPPTPKPILTDGSVMDLIISSVIKSSNAELIEITLDPTTITASRKYVAEQIEPVVIQLTQNEERFKSTSSKKGYCVIHTDDARITDYTVLLPLLQAKGVPATIAVPPGKIGVEGYMSWAQLHDVVNNHGWSLMSHTVDEIKLDTVSLEIAEYQISESRKLMEAQGFRCEHISYPNGGYNDDIMQIAKKYYSSGSTINRGVNSLPMQSYALYRTTLASTEAVLKSYADRANSEKSVHIIYTHGNDLLNDTTLQTKLNAHIDYALSIGLEFINHDQLWDLYGNTVDIGLLGSQSIENGFVISKSGEFSYNSTPSKEIVLTILGESDVPIDKSLDDYKEGYITVNQISNSGATSYPENRPGLLVVNKTLRFTGYPYREYHLYAINRVYRSIWTAQGWSPFILISNSEVLNSVSNPPVNKSANDYFLPITYEQIDNSGRADYPEGRAGMLITNRIIPFTGYIYQDYILNGVPRTYRRLWVNGAWTQFKPLNDSGGVINIPTGWTGTTVELVSGLGLEVQTDDNYVPLITANWNHGGIWVSDITTTNFKINWTTPPTIDSKIGIKLVR